MTKGTSFQNVYSYYKSFWEMLKIYLAISSDIDEINCATALHPITRVLKFAQQCYGELNDEERYSRFGLIEDLPLFDALVGEPGTNKANVQRLNKKISDLTAKLKESNSKRAEWYNKLHNTYKEKDDLTAKLKESNVKRAELSSLLKQAHEDKTKTNDKLQQTYEEKSEINQKLQQTYAEKSELNTKLQTTYAEKSERGIQMNAQQETIRELNEELNAIRNS